jgi:hypothetical protein
MANVKTFNLTIYLYAGEVTFRGISRVAVNRYIKYYSESGEHGYSGSHVEAR